jgi:2-phosphoglycolate phosphatase
MTKINVVLFDLDGTLLDTSGDLLFAINQMRKERSLEALLLDDFKPIVSHGVQAMLEHGFGIKPEDKFYQCVYDEFIEHYRSNIAHYTEIFPGIRELIEHIELLNIKWGIVTNKLHHLTLALLSNFKLFSQVSCVVGGDSTPRKKPHPDSLLYACDLLNCSPSECLYVGDIEKDIIAGKAAGMKTALAVYSYLSFSNFHSNADFILNHPLDLKKLF